MEIQKRYGIRRLALTKPSHARNIIRKVLVAILSKGDDAMIEHAGKIASLLTIWKGLYEAEQLSDMEERLQAVEERQGIGQRIDLSKAKIKR